MRQLSVFLLRAGFSSSIWMTFRHAIGITPFSPFQLLQPGVFLPQAETLYRIETFAYDLDQLSQIGMLTRTNSKAPA